MPICLGLLQLTYAKDCFILMQRIKVKHLLIGRTSPNVQSPEILTDFHEICVVDIH